MARGADAVATAALFGLVGVGVLTLLSGGRDDDGPVDEPGEDDEDGPAEGGKDVPRVATDAMLHELDHELHVLGVHDFDARDFTANRVKGERVYFMPPVQRMPGFLRMAQLAQEVRNRWGGPLFVSSAYRPQDGKRSLHYQAKAVDLDLPQGMRTTEARDELYMMMAAMYLDTDGPGNRRGFGGMGFYSQPKGRLHVDVRHNPTYWKASTVESFFKRVRALS